MEIHEMAKIFPAIKGDEFDLLVEDIRTKGLVEPITLFEDQILDGVNRYRACEVAGVNPIFQQYEGDDPRSYVISRNIRRRHLSSGQRVMILIDAGLYKPEEIHAGGDKKSNDHSRNYGNDLSQTEAAETAGVHRDTVWRTQEVVKEAPDLADEIRKGEQTAHGAHQELKKRRSHKVMKDIKKKDKSWAERMMKLPSVKEVLDAIKGINSSTDKWNRMLKKKKFSPEAARFTARRLSNLAKAIENLSVEFADFGRIEDD